jgi:hypothetical protein
VQQLSLSGGVALAALLLDGFRTAAGRTGLAASDFSAAFVVIGLLSVVPVLMFRRLAPDAGAEVSGHGRRDD